MLVACLSVIRRLADPWEFQTRACSQFGDNSFWKLLAAVVRAFVPASSSFLGSSRGVRSSLDRLREQAGPLQEGLDGLRGAEG